eukprot:1281474-Pyramimonas_sp.AAC.1
MKAGCDFAFPLILEKAYQMQLLAQGRITLLREKMGLTSLATAYNNLIKDSISEDTRAAVDLAGKDTALQCNGQLRWSCRAPGVKRSLHKIGKDNGLLARSHQPSTSVSYDKIPCIPPWLIPPFDKAQEDSSMLRSVFKQLLVSGEDEITDRSTTRFGRGGSESV